MRGIVFKFSRSIRHRPLRLPRLSFSSQSFREFLSRYALQILFLMLFVTGLTLGAAYSGSADDTLIDRLDLLFTTNLESRSSMSGVGIYLSCFSADFLFVLAAFLLGMSAWGSIALPMLVLFKGFSVGLSSAMMFMLYRGVGIGFYLLVILPGTTLFLIGFIRYLRYAFALSIRYGRLTLKDGGESFRSLSMKSYLLHSLTALLFVLGAALMDTVLWLLFAQLFDI